MMRSETSGYQRLSGGTAVETSEDHIYATEAPPPAKVAGRKPVPRPVTIKSPPPDKTSILSGDLESKYSFDDDDAPPSPLQRIFSQSGQPLSVFYVRGALSILVPFILVAYYHMTYVRWLRFPRDSSEGWIEKGYLNDAELVNYSWFVLATFALNLGAYALAGSVASMVMTKRWGPANARILVAVAENTWADASSWLKATINFIKHRTFSNGLLWNSLALLSILGFCSWPLTGLTMQTVEGFLMDMHIHGGATVIGRNHTSFNARDGRTTMIRAFDIWRLGYSPQLPLRAQLYSPEGSQMNLNTTKPNAMPDNASIPIFLAPQAEAPMVGRVFGLAVRYNCSVVTSIQNFTILSLRRDTTDEFSGQLKHYGVSGNGVNGSIFFNIGDEASEGDEIWNIKTAIEVGTTIPVANLTNVTETHFDSYIPIPGQGGLPGLSDTVIVEVALWQNITSTNFSGVVSEGFIFKEAETPIPELEGAYPGYGKAVGVRCIGGSDIGYADVNGAKASYSNFSPVEALPRRGTGTRFGHWGVKRFQNSIHHIILSSPALFFQDNSTFFSTDWAINLYASIEIFTATSNIFQDAVGTAGSVIQAVELKESVLRAYKSYALQMMYDGLPEAITRWELEDISLGHPTQILIRGAVSPEIILIMLTVWGAGISALSLIYQFSRRWTEKLDAFSMFKFGVDRPDDIDPQQLTKGRAGLESLPGLVGDTRAGSSVGAIGLVRGPGTLARRRKAYA
ncbi:hypothetical protein ABW19_dt0209243 [Dactylella cylindrospora]|nr:hypothetical protein ABW19_dt0209243 [Dactylella cylindrospora]